MRVLSRKNNRKILAIGQKAAWFTGSRNFVNMVQGGGLYGFDGIRRLCDLMTEAYQQEKDTEDLWKEKWQLPVKLVERESVSDRMYKNK